MGSTRSSGFYIAAFGGLMAFGPMTMDLYLPAFPSVTADLETTETLVQLTLTATIVGFGVGQLLIGPFSDGWGRRRPLIMATLLHISASIAIMFAPTIEWVMACRVAQGIGAAGSGVLAMAMARDLFEGQGLVRILSKMALVTALAPVLAPVIGSQLLQVVSWRGLFAVLAVFGAAMAMVGALLVGETLPAEKRRGNDLKAMGARYRTLLGDRVFVGIMIIGGMTFSTMFVYLSWSSFIYQKDFGLSAQQYGFLFAANAVGLASCAQVSGRLMRRLPPTLVMGGWLSVMLLCALLLLVTDHAGMPHFVSIGLVFIIISVHGGVSPAVQATGLSRHGALAGTAAAMLGLFNFGVGGIIAPFIGILGVSIAAMATGMLAVLVVAHLSLIFIVKPQAVGIIS